MVRRAHRRAPSATNGMSVPGKSEDRLGIFATTHWSVVLAAKDPSDQIAAGALERLCGTYWYPLYAFLRRQGKSVEEAEDLTQEFFARVLAKGLIGFADPCRGRFRSFLLACLANFSAERHRHDTRIKRGGGVELLRWDALAAEERYSAEPCTEVTPETLFEKRWATTVIKAALDALKAELEGQGKGRLLEEIEGHLWGGGATDSYGEIAGRVGMSEGALKVAVHRLRHRFGELLRGEVANTVCDPSDVADELRHLIAAARGG
jgi:DNA-directed RNA polymerase specialized sigma24 family protein